MEKKNNNKLLIICFIITLLFAVFGIIGTVYFYGKSLSKKQTTDESINVGTVEGFNSLFDYTLEDGKSTEISINNKKLVFKNEGGSIYFNDQKIATNTPNFHVTNKLVFFDEIAGQFGTKYLVYDLDGNLINTSINDGVQLGNLSIRDGKLFVSVFNTKMQWMSGYRIGDLTVLGENESKYYANCSKTISDYPDIVLAHKDDVLSADYYIDYTNGEVSLKIDKVLQTVEQFANINPDACIID